MQKLENKRGNVNMLTGVAYSIIGLALIVGIGLTILTKFGDSVVTCTGTLSGTPVWNATTQLCYNGTTTATGAGSSYTSLAYGATQLGSTGLLSWLPAIIALLVGIFFFAYFMNRKGGGGY